MTLVMSISDILGEYFSKNFNPMFSSKNSLEIIKHTLILLVCLVTLISCSDNKNSRIIEDFNIDWKFQLGEVSGANELSFNDSEWETLSVPHDWSIDKGYYKEGETASSTGFVLGGIGWYRKSFTLSEADKEKYIRILFDGVYNNSTVWINGNLLGTRPNGYSSFGYDLTPFLKFDGSNNVVAVKVNRKAYVDSRWYTGSGIYRKVTLIKTSKLHIKQWGVAVSTPEVNKESASVKIRTTLEQSGALNLEGVSVKYSIFDSSGVLVDKKETNVSEKFEAETTAKVVKPKLWSLEKPNLYTVEVAVFKNGDLLDNVTERFGIRTFDFNSEKGFSLNGKHTKIKGVNLHHDAGAVGAAVPKGIWEYRIKKLKSIGVNAVRFSHNPHAKELLEVCDEMGMLVMNEAFDEWSNPKEKSKVFLGDNAASEEASKAYPTHFNDWAERDLKDLIKRDYNHPSVFMISIGNEIEWTFPHYSKTFNDVNVDFNAGSYDFVPEYDSLKIKPIFEKNIDGNDPLTATAQQLVKWAKEVDTTRPITCGSVLPSIGMTSGYGKAVDVFGFNYRASDYDAAHKAYPDLKIIGSENWGDYKEWKSVRERDFVSGIFVWTGFAYMGEAGPWPRKGLEISFFDYAGFKTPRGHFFECLWKKDPKVYMVTTPAEESEFSFDKKEGWKFTMQLTPPPVWSMLRKWEWYTVNSKWKYQKEQPIVVQTYTNCEEAELFLNGSSLGKQKLSDYSETDNIIKWLVPYSAGELKVVGYNKGEKVDEYVLNTTGDTVKEIKVETTKARLVADGYDVAIVTASLIDEKGNLITDADKEITFNVTGAHKNLGVDNGWEMNVQPHKTNKLVTHGGKAIFIVQSTKEKGAVYINVSQGEVVSKTLSLQVE